MREYVCVDGVLRLFNHLVCSIISNFICCSDPYVKMSFHGSCFKVYPHFTTFAHFAVPANYKTKTIPKVTALPTTYIYFMGAHRPSTLSGMPLTSLQ